MKPSCYQGRQLFCWLGLEKLRCVCGGKDFTRQVPFAQHFVLGCTATQAARCAALLG